MTTNPPDYVSGHGLLDGLGVVVTAAAGSGIGSSTARRCLEEGARVVISDRHERRLAETAAELGVTGIPCDVTDDASVRALMDQAAAELGGIDVLVNNAGLGGTAEVHEMTELQKSDIRSAIANFGLITEQMQTALKWDQPVPKKRK